MWETLRKEEVERKLNTDFSKGLNNDEVLKRQNQYGKNELENGKKEGIIIKFFKQFNDLRLDLRARARGVDVLANHVILSFILV